MNKSKYNFFLFLALIENNFFKIASRLLAFNTTQRKILIDFIGFLISLKFANITQKNQIFLLINNNLLNNLLFR
jgi:hypothetical protein